MKKILNFAKIAIKNLGCFQVDFYVTLVKVYFVRNVRFKVMIKSKDHVKVVGKIRRNLKDCNNSRSLKKM